MHDGWMDIRTEKLNTRKKNVELTEKYLKIEKNININDIKLFERNY